MAYTLEELEARAREVGTAVHRCTPPGVGFAVLLFEHGGGQMTYVSNSNRADMIRALRECATTLELMQDQPPRDPFTGRSAN